MISVQIFMSELLEKTDHLLLDASGNPPKLESGAGAPPLSMKDGPPPPLPQSQPRGIVSKFCCFSSSVPVVSRTIIHQSNGRASANGTNGLQEPLLASEAGDLEHGGEPAQVPNSKQRMRIWSNGSSGMRSAPSEEKQVVASFGPPMEQCEKCNGSGKGVQRDEHGCIEMGDCEECAGSGKVAMGDFHTHEHGKHAPDNFELPLGHEAVRVVHIPNGGKIITISPAQYCCRRRPGKPLSRLNSNYHPGQGTKRGPSADQNITGFATLVALTIHSFLEGLGAGAARNEEQAFAIILAIACHKGFAAFALSSVFLPLRNANPESSFDPWISVVVWFALASPFAIIAGALLEQNLDSANVSILICVAAGTLAYVGISEMLIPALSKKSAGKRLTKLFLAISGTAMMSMLAIYC